MPYFIYSRQLQETSFADLVSIANASLAIQDNHKIHDTLEDKEEKEIYTATENSQLGEIYIYI